MFFFSFLFIWDFYFPAICQKVISHKQTISPWIAAVFTWFSGGGGVMSPPGFVPRGFPGQFSGVASRETDGICQMFFVLPWV